MRLSFALLTATAMMASSAEAFAITKSTMPATTRAAKTTVTAAFATPPEKQNEVSFETAGKMAVTTATVWAATAQNALADSPDWGLFEGRIGSLLHPTMMVSLLTFSLSTALLGFQWRRQRTMGDEIKDLKKTLPDLNGAASVSAALQEATEPAQINALKAAIATETQVNELVAERKGLVAAAPKDKHFSQGTILVLLGTVFAIEGPLNTYARAGKLFPGPHLYAGAGLVCLWALAAACVPGMQKGNGISRTVHIGANVSAIGLFGWQVVSGIPILLKVLEKTSFP